MKCYEVDLSHILKVTLLGRTRQVPGGRHVTRQTGEYIVYAIADGTLCFEHNGEALELLPGDICVFNKGEFQRPLKSTACEYYYLHFQTDAFCEKQLSETEFCETVKARKADFVKADIYGPDSYGHMKALLKTRLHVDDKARFEHILSFFKNNRLSYASNDPLRRLSISFAAASLLMTLETLSVDTLSKSGSGKAVKVYDTVQRIADYIGEHYRENFGSREIERDLYINFDYANRIFKKHIGYSIIQYRNRLRINTAKALVTSESLDEVAFSVGFSDRYYFSRCFKRFEGVSPKEYRDNDYRTPKP